MNVWVILSLRDYEGDHFEEVWSTEDGAVQRKLQLLDRQSEHDSTSYEVRECSVRTEEER